MSVSKRSPFSRYNTIIRMSIIQTFPLISPQKEAGSRLPPLYPTYSGAKRVSKAIDFAIKYKTEPCRSWEKGTCKYGENCAFAHGIQELREKTHISTRYRTQQCYHFFELGYCLYGQRCQFKHRAEASTAPGSRTDSRKSSMDESVPTTSNRLRVFTELASGKV